LRDFPSDDDSSVSRRRWNAALLVVLVAGCALSVSIWNGARRADRRVARERFDRAAEMVARLADDHVHLIEGALRSSRGLILGSQTVEPEEWRRFAASLREHGGLPGVSELFMLVPRDDGVEPALRESRAGELPGVGDASFRDAVARARDEATPAVTVPDGSFGPEDPLHVVLAVYSHATAPGTRDERRRELRGWVCARIDLREVFGASLGRDAARLRARVVAAAPDRDGPDVYDSFADPPAEPSGRLSARFPVAIADREWTLRVDSRPAFDAVETGSHPIVLVVGLALSAALWGGGRVVLAARDAAIRDARQRTRELRWAEGRYREVFLGSAQTQLLVHPDDGRILDANPAACAYFGYDADRLRRMSLSALAAADGGDVDAVLRAGHTDASASEVRLRLRLASGLVRDVDVVACRIRVEQRPTIHLAVRDVTEREEIERLQRITARVFETASEAILVTDRYNRIDMVNPAFTRISGYTAAEARGRDLSMLEAGLNPQSLLRDIQRGLARDGVWHGQIQCRRADGEVHPGRLSISAIDDDGRTARRHVVVFSDLSQRLRSPGETAAIDHVDPLTGVADRALFLDRLRREVEHARRNDAHVAVLVVDLDRFREVNERFGHSAGDEALRELAGRIAGALRSSDTVGRLGGDEFAVVATEIEGPEGCADLAHRVLSALAEPLPAGGNRLEITGTVGVALFPDDAPDADRLLGHAESALTRAKTSPSGPRYRFFSSETDERTRARAARASELGHALERGEFDLYWQPIWDLVASRVAGAEALLRWRHPTLGMLEPKRFLPGASDARLRVGMAAWLVREACRRAADWAARGLVQGFTVGVNLAGEELRDDALVAAIVSHAGSCGGPSARLTLEVPESAWIRQGAHLAEPLSRLRSAGVGVLVDDAGLHDPLLRYLDGIELDGIKVHGSLFTATSAGALRALADAGRRRGLPLWGKKIDSDVALVALRHAGGTRAQGGMFGPAAPVEELELRLTTAPPHR